MPLKLQKIQMAVTVMAKVDIKIFEDILAILNLLNIESKFHHFNLSLKSSVVICKLHKN